MNAAPALDVAVIGGGVVGLAVARALALAGREVALLEAERALGSHTSSRNSEVIHAGIYYATGSEKATLCVAGKALLYEYCEREDVAHARLGRLIVATRDEELPALERILAQARANGVDDPARALREGALLRARGQSAISSARYPISVPGGLGVQVTLDLAGQAPGLTASLAIAERVRTLLDV